MGGSSKKVTVGYRYHLGVHMVLCHGPIDAIREVLVDERRAYVGYTPGGSITIDKPGLFGGEAREGGVTGKLDFDFGSSTQVQNAYLQSQLGNDIPAYRGVVSAIFNRVYMGLNPYLKQWSFRASRILTTTGGAEQWYVQKSEIADPSEGYVLAQTFDFDMDATDPGWHPPPAGTQDPPLNTVTLNVPPTALVKVTLPTGRLYSAWSAWSTTSLPTQGWLASFYYYDNDGNLLYVTENGVNGITPFYGTPEEARANFGEQVLTGSTKYEFHFRDNPVDDNRGGMSPHIEVWVSLGSPDMNPAHIIRECLTDPVWGMGYNVADIDDTAFIAAADTLFDENFGISMVWDQQGTVEDFISEILRHIDASLYVDRVTGKFVLKLIRDDYDVNSLITLNESNIKRVSKYERTNPSELVNSVTVIYEASDGTKSAATADDVALIQTMGQVISTSVQYLGISKASVAEKVVSRDLKQLSQTLLTVVIEVNRVASSLNVGDTFKFEWPDFHDSYIVMRVQQISLGDGKSNTIKITATEDIFSTPETLFVSTEIDPGTSVGGPPLDVANRFAAEVPYYELVQSQGQLTTDQQLTDNNDLGYVVAAGTAPLNGINAEIWTDAGAGYEFQGLVDFAPSAILSGVVDRVSTVWNYTSGLNLDVVTIGSHAQIGTELVKVEAIDAVLGTITVGRSALDTVPVPHADASLILFWDAYSAADATQYVATEVVNVKLLTNSTEGTLDLADATAETVTMASRAFKPYPPGNLKVSGSYFPASQNDATDIALTWSHRDRLQQTAGDIYTFTDLDIGPELGTTYEIDFYGETDTLIRSVTAIAGTSYTYTTAQEIIDSAISHPSGNRLNGTVRVVLHSRRDGYPSFQEHDFTVDRHGYGFNYGKYYGGE